MFARLLGDRGINNLQVYRWLATKGVSHIAMFRNLHETGIDREVSQIGTSDVFYSRTSGLTFIASTTPKLFYSKRFPILKIFLRVCYALESWRLKAPSSIECYYYLGGHHKMFAVLNLQNKDIIRITDRSAFVKSDHPAFNTETGSIELIGSTPQGMLTQITNPNTRDHYRP